jgi:hypothetical protein
MAAVRTDIAVCQRAANVVPAEPAKADEPAVQEDADIQVMVLNKVMLVQLPFDLCCQAVCDNPGPALYCCYQMMIIYHGEVDRSVFD